MLMKKETMENRFLVAKVTQAFTVKVVVLVHLLNLLSLGIGVVSFHYFPERHIVQVVCEIQAKSEAKARIVLSSITDCGEHGRVWEKCKARKIENAWKIPLRNLD